MAKASKTQQALIENVLDYASSFKRGNVQSVSFNIQRKISSSAVSSMDDKLNDTLNTILHGLQEMDYEIIDIAVNSMQVKNPLSGMSLNFNYTILIK
ncbi:hypothetical protein FON45_13720 [Enterococcus faecium]|jgi:hypothetical protein|uniref:hypothetical protein n=1 Tax=Enterococcus TaxID=1350 RepID=UPI0002AF30DD|nr:MULTISPECIES: hypothetical protein [Enterococcus]MBC9720864.1 hypothetical protein [Lactobacillus sp.]DAM03571.1 MAG TPA: hypothetical protein [Caudoviricetes sp.]AGE30683.1 hypothetical protein M7W_2078 [Enterococcus faecium ATCC 8459 = NRRL B-2354]EGP4823169.1 hypothetical protein [Enterococcus faecium]EGP4952193.1 hypothetical protein [Enterococcus faecium]